MEGKVEHKGASPSFVPFVFFVVEQLASPNSLPFDTLATLSKKSRALPVAMRLRRALTIVALLTAGCSGSRWARDDPDYAAKYSAHTDNVLRTSKQAIDARHVKGKSGPYVGLAGRGDPFALGGDIGMFMYPTSYLELRGGASGLIYENDTPVTGGLTGGVRLQTPTRLAPFVGLGAYGGFTPNFIEVDNGRDDNNNGYIDDSSEVDTGAVLALVPEAGGHFWITSDWRLTAGLSYLLTTDGGDDFLLASISLAKITSPAGPTTQRALAKAAADRGWKVGDGAPAEEVTSPPAPSELTEPLMNANAR